MEGDPVVSEQRTFLERRFVANDGLSLYYRDYPSPALSPVLVCLAGNTRNSKDFHDFALRYVPRYRIVAPDYRGRGQSARATTAESYARNLLLDDLVVLLRDLRLQRYVVVGTSLGGMLGMALAATRAEGLAGLILNDIGPEMGAAGISRYSKLGYREDIADLADGAGELRRMYGADYPTFSDNDWRAMARLFFIPAPAGLRWDFDMALVRPSDKPRSLPNLWPEFDAAGALPMLLLRGALSDLLTEEIANRMADAKPSLKVVTVPDRGHNPLLNEPQATAAIDSFLNSLA